MIGAEARILVIQCDNGLWTVFHMHVTTSW